MCVSVGWILLFDILFVTSDEIVLNFESRFSKILIIMANGKHYSLFCRAIPLIRVSAWKVPIACLQFVLPDPLPVMLLDIISTYYVTPSSFFLTASEAVPI